MMSGLLMAMTRDEEKDYWKRLVNDLQGVMTIAEIAVAVGVEDRQVWRWKSGERRPMGMLAVHVYLLHVKRCPTRQCLNGHSAQGEKG
jgi:hypothetical protein